MSDIFDFHVQSFYDLSINDFINKASTDKYYCCGSRVVTVLNHFSRIP